MVQTAKLTNTELTNTELTNTEDLKAQIKRLNSKAGQMKMDLHDLAEGLPTDYDRLIEAATQTYQIYRQIDELRQQLKQLESQLQLESQP